MNKDFYIRNRERIAELLENNSVMLLYAGRNLCRSEDEAYEFVINRNFYYLTGINEQNDILAIIKKDDKVVSKIFINPYDEYTAKWVGRHLLEDEVENLSGIQEISHLADFNTFLDEALKEELKIYLDIAKPLFAEPYTESRILAKELETKGITPIDCHDLIAVCRMEKQPEEIVEMRKAIEVTNQGIKALMNNIKPGLIESQVESYFDQQIKFYGASGFAFKTIAASGKNACVLHYSTNNTVIQDDELVLFDLGAEYNLYKADITRTIPANGKFTERQKQIYNIVLEGQRLVFEAIKPGVTTRDLNNILIKYYMGELKRIGLIKNDNEVRNYYFHGVSHHLGLDTHDVCLRDKPLTPGCVITVEPGLYIPEEAIGIRIEDDALVTENGCINLSSDIIKTVEEIEEFMKKKS